MHDDKPLSKNDAVAMTKQHLKSKGKISIEELRRQLDYDPDKGHEPDEPYFRLNITAIDTLIAMGGTPKSLKFLAKVREHMVAGDFDSASRLFGGDPPKPFKVRAEKNRSKPLGFGKVNLQKQSKR